MQINKFFQKLVLSTFFFIFLFTIPNKVYAHGHTADCYGGTLHTCEGNSESGGNCYTAKETNCQGTLTYSGAAQGDLTCPSCATVCGTYTKFTVKCNSCSYNGISYQNTNDTCSSCGASLKQSDETITYGNPCPSTFTVYNKTCGKTTGRYYNSNGQYLSPTCNKVVVSITPKEQTQKTATPNFTLVATYLDGHTAEINPTKVDYANGNTYNNSTITMSYTGIVTRVGNNGTLTTSITLTTPVTSTPTPTPTATSTPTVTPTSTPTSTPTITITPTITSTPTIAPTSTPIVEENSIDVETSLGYAKVDGLEDEIPTSTPTATPTPTITQQKVNDNDKTLGGTFYESDETEGVEEERDYTKTTNKDKGISFAAILLIVFAIIFIIGLIAFGIMYVVRQKKNSVPVNKINLNEHIRKY